MKGYLKFLTRDISNTSFLIYIACLPILILVLEKTKIYALIGVFILLVYLIAQYVDYRKMKKKGYINY
jgi:hypothetical protein